MNRVILIGRLTREPDIKFSQSENGIMTVAKLSLAVTRKFKKNNEQDCDFINCTAFGKTAEIIQKFAKKGAKICVEGEWRTGSYTNKDGKKVYTNDCLISSFEFCESKSYSESKPQIGLSDFNNDVVEISDDDDLPF